MQPKQLLPKRWGEKEKQSSWLLTSSPDQQQLVAWAAASSLAGVDLLSGLSGNLALDAQLGNQADIQTVGVALSYVDPASDGGSLRLFFATDPGANTLVLNRYYRYGRCYRYFVFFAFY